MVKIPALNKKTVSAIFTRYETEVEDWRRSHLGASLIGRECHRELWYSFRWTIKPDFEGRILRLFERGHREEEWVAEDLRGIGVELLTLDPRTDEQFRVSWHNGHFGGGADGIGRGFLEAPKTWHLWECKTANKKQFDILQSKGVKEAKREHYDQMQVYMHGLKLKRAFYSCVCKDDDRIYTERIYYVEDEAEAIIAKAGTIIESSEPLSKISEDLSWWKCKFCNARPICHLGEVDKLERNCRTCASATPQPTGGWFCDHHQKKLSDEDQRAGCDAHLFIPALLPWKATEFVKAQRAVVYEHGDETIVDHQLELKRDFVLAEPKSTETLFDNEIPESKDPEA